MTEDSVRKALSALPVATAPADLSARLRVTASHERERRLRRNNWFERVSLHLNLLLKPLAVPAMGGLLSTVLLFGALADSLNVRRYLAEDLPLGIYTGASISDLSPFAANGGDILVEVTIDRDGHVSDYSVPNGKVSADQLRQIGNLILFSTFTPATAYGQRVSGKILVALHHINVRG